MLLLNILNAYVNVNYVPLFSFPSKKKPPQSESDLRKLEIFDPILSIFNSIKYKLYE